MARPPYEDPFDAAEAATERAAMRGLERFARFFHVAPGGVWAKLLLPLAAMAVGAVLLTVLTWDMRYRVWAFIAVYFAPFGMETGVPTGVGFLDLPPFLIIAIVLYVDFFMGLFLVWNLDHLTRIPRFGPWLSRLETKSAAKWARHRRLRDLGVIGLGIFVMIPISGSGAVPGALIGRIAGFPWGLVWLAIFVGSAVRVVAYTLAAVWLKDLFF